MSRYKVQKEQRAPQVPCMPVSVVAVVLYTLVLQTFRVPHVCKVWLPILLTKTFNEVVDPHSHVLQQPRGYTF